MPLKFKVEKIEDVPEEQRALYVEDKAAGGFKLDAEGIDDPVELKRAKDHEVTARKAAEKKLKDLEAARTAELEAARVAAEEAAKKEGNIAALEKSWGEKLASEVAAIEAKYKPQVNSLESDVNRLLIDNRAQEIATRIALPDAAHLVAEQIQKRLRVDVRDGQRVTVVVDRDGKPSASTLADLEKEIVADKGLSRLLAGSKGSGGGANGGKGGGAADSSKQITRQEFEALDPVKRAAHFKGGGSVVDPT